MGFPAMLIGLILFGFSIALTGAIRFVHMTYRYEVQKTPVAFEEAAISMLQSLFLMLTGVFFLLVGWITHVQYTATQVAIEFEKLVDKIVENFS